jgi:hypothetical protein
VYAWNRLTSFVSVYRRDESANMSTTTLLHDTFIRRAVHVLTSDQGDVVILLCLKTSAYYTLDEVGSVVWMTIESGATCRDVVDAVLRRTLNGGSQAATEIRAFVAELVAKGLVAIGAPEQAHSGGGSCVETRLEERPLTLPSVWLCSLTLLAISLLLRIVGLARVWRWARTATPRYVVPPASPCLSQLASRVALASTICPCRSECLEQSLFILWWLRRQRVVAELQLGVLQYPFKAHAWVESAGTPVNDHPDRLSHYNRFPIEAWCASCSPR